MWRFKWTVLFQWCEKHYTRVRLEYLSKLREKPAPGLQASAADADVRIAIKKLGNFTNVRS